MGQIIYVQPVSGKQEDIILDLSAQPEGLYVVELRSGNKTVNLKISKR